MSCVGFDGSNFAIKVEAKVNLRRIISRVEFLHDVWWVFHRLPLCAF